MYSHAKKSMLWDRLKKKIIEGKIAIIIYIVFLKKLLFNQSSTMFRLQSTLPYGSHSCPIEDMGIDI